MVNKRAEKFIGQRSNVQLIPITLVHVPCRFNLRIPVAQFNGIIRIAFYTKPLGVFKVTYRKNPVLDPECKCSFVEWEILCSILLAQAI